jgi:hypothetical protein
MPVALKSGTDMIAKIVPIRSSLFGVEHVPVTIPFASRSIPSGAAAISSIPTKKKPGVLSALQP